MLMSLFSKSSTLVAHAGTLPATTFSCVNDKQQQSHCPSLPPSSLQRHENVFSKLAVREWRQEFGTTTERRSSVCAASAAAAAVVPVEVVDSGKPAAAKPLRPSAAELARTLTAVCGEGTLATVSPDGWPLTTLVQFALDAEGRPVMSLEPGAVHTVNLDKDNRCSLHVQLELPGKQKPQCTLKGRVYMPQDDMSALRLETAWQRRYGKDMGIEERKHPLCWLEVEEALSMQDIGEEEIWVAGNEYSTAAADPLRDCAAKIVDDINREHWEDVRRFCNAYAGMDEEVEEASMTWVDRLGFDLRILTRAPQEIREVRIPFAREVTDDRDARSSIIMMAQIAWERERHYIPPDIPLLGGQNIS